MFGKLVCRAEADVCDYIVSLRKLRMLTSCSRACLFSLRARAFLFFFVRHHCRCKKLASGDYGRPD